MPLAKFKPQPQPQRNTATLRETHFDNQRLARLGVEVMTLDTLRARVAPARLAAPERVDFWVLLWLTRGLGAHTVDFQTHRVQAGSVVLVRPGQVQQWHLQGPQLAQGQAKTALQGLMVLVAPAAWVPVAREPLLAAGLDDLPDVLTVPGPQRAEIQAQFLALSDEFARADLSELGMAIVQTLLTTLLLRLRRLASQADQVVPLRDRQQADVVRLLQRALNQRLRDRPTVQSLSAMLGYSVSTLNRACLALRGCPAKALIDRRIALEAQRLLVHGNQPSGQVGLQLGFSEPTNFLKFFRRLVGCTPEAFRLRHARSAADGPTAAAAASPATRGRALPKPPAMRAGRRRTISSPSALQHAT